MLKKLLKYDLKWCYKNLVVFYLLAIIFSGITRIIEQHLGSFMFLILDKIFSATTISILVSILINNFMRVWARFVNNIYKDESYLTHTLPVKKSEIFFSKILTAIITFATSFIVILASLAIVWYSKDNWLRFKTYDRKHSNLF